jgi:hypothetical protein
MSTPLKRNVDAGHTDILDNAEVGEVVLAESHPKTGAFQRWEVLYEAFEFLLIDQVRTDGAAVRVVDHLHGLVQLGLDPLAVFPVSDVLRHLADIDFRLVKCSASAAPGVVTKRKHTAR